RRPGTEAVDPAHPPAGRAAPGGSTRNSWQPPTCASPPKDETRESATLPCRARRGCWTAERLSSFANAPSSVLGIRHEHRTDYHRRPALPGCPGRGRARRADRTRPPGPLGPAAPDVVREPPVSPVPPVDVAAVELGDGRDA